MLFDRRAVMLAALVAAYRCGGGAPAAPGTSLVARLQVACPASIFVGQTSSCVATAQFADGHTMVVNPTANWSSSDTAVALLDAVGGVIGQSAGQVQISASYGGQMGSAPVSVRAEDALLVTASLDQGELQVGKSEMLALIGYYGVASADSGQLSLIVTDQNGIVVSTSAPMTVQKGGNFFEASSTFIIPPSATQVCRLAVLQIGDTSLKADGGSALRPCLPVRQ
jgi:hypothetical protein